MGKQSRNTFLPVTFFSKSLIEKFSDARQSVRCIGFPYSKNTLQNISSRKRLNSIHPLYLLMISENLTKLFIHSLGEIISYVSSLKSIFKNESFWINVLVFVFFPKILSHLVFMIDTFMLTIVLIQVRIKWCKQGTYSKSHT